METYYLSKQLIPPTTKHTHHFLHFLSSVLTCAQYTAHSVCVLELARVTYVSFAKFYQIYLLKMSENADY